MAVLIASVLATSSRSAAGPYDNKGLSTFALLLTFHLFVKVVSLSWFLVFAIGHFDVVSAWIQAARGKQPPGNSSYPSPFRLVNRSFL